MSPPSNAKRDIIIILIILLIAWFLWFLQKGYQKKPKSPLLDKIIIERQI